MGMSHGGRVLKTLSGFCLVGASIGLGASAVQAAARHHKAPVIMHGYKCTVVATTRHTHVVGHAGAVVCGASGNDVLRAKGRGRIVLIAGPGRDTLIASSTSGSQDTLIGGSGDDTLEGSSSGDDTIEAGTGNDTIDCGGSTSSGTGSDQASISSTGGQVTVVGADSTDDTENADCQGSNVDSAALEFQGKVNTTDGTTMNITIFDENDQAQTWLAANGNPTAVDISLTGASIEVDNGGTLAAGDYVEVAANASGSSLTAIDVQAHLPAASGFDD